MSFTKRPDCPGPLILYCENCSIDIVGIITSIYTTITGSQAIVLLLKRFPDSSVSCWCGTLVGVEGHPATKNLFHWWMMAIFPLVVELNFVKFDYLP